MSIRLLLALIGSTILFVGVFLPVVTLPIIGDMNLFHNGEGMGIFILSLTSTGIIIALLKQYFWNSIVSVGILGLLAYLFLNFQERLEHAKAQIATELAGNPFGGLAQTAMSSVQLQYGWAVLIVGAILLFSSSVVKDQQVA